MVAGELCRVFRRKTDVVARYGGEEFIILMPGEKMTVVMAMAEKLRERLERSSIEFEGESIRTTLSIGIAARQPDRDTPKRQLLSEADQALYQAKSAGRNRICRHGDDRAAVGRKTS